MKKFKIILAGLTLAFCFNFAFAKENKKQQTKTEQNNTSNIFFNEFEKELKKQNFLTEEKTVKIYEEKTKKIKILKLKEFENMIKKLIEKKEISGKDETTEVYFKNVVDLSKQKSGSSKNHCDLKIQLNNKTKKLSFEKISKNKK